MKSIGSASDVLRLDITEIMKATKSELDILSGGNVLITGGAGFLGYMLINVLAQVGLDDGRHPIRITVFDNFVRGEKKWLNQLSAENVNLSIVLHDISKPLPIDMPEFTHIIHAASIASPTFYRLNPIQTIDANINGLRYLLDYAKHRIDIGRPISGILFFSSSEIYGDPTDEAIPTPETYRGLVSCTGPRACYDESKRFGETLCVNFATQYGVKVKIARPFNNYGPGLDLSDRRLLPDLARNILQNNDIVLYSDGLATRTFCYVSDAVAGYIKVLVNGDSGEAYNIGSESPEISVIDFANMVACIGRDIYGYSGKITNEKSIDQAYLTDNPNRRCPNINKARFRLGFRPSVSLDDGLFRTLVWYGKNKL